MANPSYFLNDPTNALRQPEVVAASFVNGCNAAASCAPGIGINADGGAVIGEPQQFTLLDQFVLPRVPQTSQNIGGPGYTDPAGWPSSGGEEGTLPNHSVRIGIPSANGDGVVTGLGNATLADIAVGWIFA